MRLPNDREAALLNRFREADIPACRELSAQLAAVETAEVTDGFIDLSIPKDVPELTSTIGFPVSAWYPDSDGFLVSLLLHQASGRASCLERLRGDGLPIEDVLPDAACLRVQEEPPIDEFPMPVPSPEYVERVQENLSRTPFRFVRSRESVN